MCCLRVALLILLPWRASLIAAQSIMSVIMVPSTARSTLAIDWDSETRSLYYDEQEAEVGHLGFLLLDVLI